MKRISIAVLAVIALVLSAGAAAAMPGGPPDHAADENAPADANHAPNDAGQASDDARNEDASDAGEAASDGHAANAAAKSANAGDRSENASAREGDVTGANAQGPATDLPEQVPSHVERIHAVILQFLQGDGETSLGERVSSVASGNATPGERTVDDGTVPVDTATGAPDSATGSAAT